MTDPGPCGFDLTSDNGREVLAAAIHAARWPADRQLAVTPFADEDRNGREYCFRIADAVLAISAGADTREAVIEECAKQADLAKEAARQNYGVAESVGADIAARRIRALKRTGTDGAQE